MQEKYYSRYCDALERDLDDKLKLFHVTNSQTLSLEPLRKFIEQSLIDVLVNWQDDNINQFIIDNDRYTSTKRKRYNTSTRLYQSFITEYEAFKTFKTKGKLLEHISDSDVERYRKKVEAWKADMSFSCIYFEKNVYSYLVEFPLFHVLPKKKMKAMYECDILYNIFRLCGTEAYTNFVQIYPQTSGVFTGERIRSNWQYTQSYDEEIQAAAEFNYNLELVPSLDNGNIQMAMKLSQEADKKDFLASFKPFKMDEKCKRIISYLTSETLKKLATNIETNADDSLSIKGSINDICALIADKKDAAKHYSGKHRIKALNYLLNVSNFRMISKTDESFKSSAFVETLSLGKSHTDEESGYDLFEVKIGNAIIESILNEKTEIVLTSHLQSINSATGRLLYGAMRTHRLSDLSRGVTTHVYDLISLMMIASVAGAKSEKFKKYKEALTEIQLTGLLFDSFEFKNPIFKVKWLPFTEDEKRDISSDITGRGYLVAGLIDNQL